MEEKRNEAFPDQPMSTSGDAPPPYGEQFPTAVGYRGAPGGGGYDQLPPAQASYPKTEPYPPTQQYPQQQYGYPQGSQPPGYSAAPVVMQPAQVQPVRVGCKLMKCIEDASVQ